MKCKNCGREIPEGSNFCEFCGATITPFVKKSKKSYGKYWLIALLIWGAAVIFYILIFIATGLI